MAEPGGRLSPSAQRPPMIPAAANSMILADRIGPRDRGVASVTDRDGSHAKGNLLRGKWNGTASSAGVKGDLEPRQIVGVDAVALHARPGGQSR